MDAPEQSAGIVARLGLGYPVLCDTEREVITLYGVRHDEPAPGVEAIARPATFLIDEHGRVIWRSFAENWRIRLRPEALLARL